MRKLTLFGLIFLLLGLSGCYYHNQLVKKPFLIIGKVPYHYEYHGVDYLTTRYFYSDSLGQIGEFYDVDTLYYIGDIIK